MGTPKPPYWLSSTRTPTCRNGHPYKSFKDSGTKSVLETRGDCHHFMTCGTCHQMAFGVQSAGHELIHWYDVPEKALMDALLEQPHTTKTWVFLEALGFWTDTASHHTRDHAA